MVSNFASSILFKPEHRFLQGNHADSDQIEFLWLKPNTHTRFSTAEFCFYTESKDWHIICHLVFNLILFDLFRYFLQVNISVDPRLYTHQVPICIPVSVKNSLFLSFFWLVHVTYLDSSRRHTHSPPPQLLFSLFLFLSNSILLIEALWYLFSFCS